MGMVIILITISTYGAWFRKGSKDLEHFLFTYIDFKIIFFALPCTSTSNTRQAQCKNDFRINKKKISEFLTIVHTLVVLQNFIS